MPLRKEPPTPRSAAVAARLDPSSEIASSGLAPLIPFKPGQTSLRRQAILTEDEYTSALSSIIKRDFFPSLDRITAENEYLAAVESEEPMRIRVALNQLLRFDRAGEASPAPQSRRKQRRRDVLSATSAGRSEKGEWDDTPVASGSSSRIFNPTFTPAACTPGLNSIDQEQHQDDDTAEPASGITPDLGLSLADFQARYTSEDNASFSQLLDRDNQMRKRKHAHLFARERASEQRREQITRAEERDAAKGKQLAIEANPDHPKLLEQPKAALLIEDSNARGKQKATAPEQTSAPTNAKDPLDDLILVPEPRQDDRPPPTGLTRCKYTARNALMYAPDANESYLHARPSAPTPQPTAQPATNFASLRLPDEPDLTEASQAGWSPSSSRVDAAIRRGRAGSFSSAADDTPKVNGYGFVTPYSTPQHGSEEVHLKIYDAIKARRSTEGGFQLPKLGKREELAQRLTPAGSTPYGKAKYGGLAGLRAKGFASPRKAALTPAARALLERSTGTTSPAVARRDSKDTLGHRGWTPTPRR